ncbi:MULTISPECIES: hypothetical protein [Chelativorans]|jgi:hypothetical protein|uniref:Uncharacterized protein n=1 Tax=Chelativorans sp. (strain BNC1) TaxID=266779 RepID=Q11LW3_CHESB|nr:MULTISPECIES: hypothetical protein [Chelativorans]
MRLPFCETITDPDTDKPVLMDIEGEADCCLDWDAKTGERIVCVTDVYVNGVNLYRSQMSMFRQMAALIAERIEADDKVLDVLLEVEREVA